MQYKIITPVATEPVTLAEAKLHIRALSDAFVDDLASYQSIVPAGYSTEATGAAVDVLGKMAMVNLNAGTCTGTITAKIQESDDNVTWQDFASFTVVTSANDNAIQEKEYTGGKQYIRVIATATATCNFGADVLVKSGDLTEDEKILDMITAAREYCENYTGRALATQTIEAFADGFGALSYIELPKAPLQSVTSVKYKDSAGAETTLTVNTDYIVDTDSDIGRIVLPYGTSWPTFSPYPLNPVRIRYIAGYYASNPAPRSIKQAVLLLIGHWYVNREAVGNVGGQIEFAVKALLRPYQARWWD